MNTYAPKYEISKTIVDRIKVTIMQLDILLTEMEILNMMREDEENEVDDEQK